MSKKAIPPKLKKAVFIRDDYTCRYCGSTQGPLHCDHVYPESKGGETTVRNLVTACQDCNLKKHAKVGIWPISLKDAEEERERLRKENERGKDSMFFHSYASITVLTSLPALAAVIYTWVAGGDDMISITLYLMWGFLFLFSVLYRSIFYRNGLLRKSAKRIHKGEKLNGTIKETL